MLFFNTKKRNFFVVLALLGMTPAFAEEPVSEGAKEEPQETIFSVSQEEIDRIAEMIRTGLIDPRVSTEHQTNHDPARELTNEERETLYKQQELLRDSIQELESKPWLHRAKTALENNPYQDQAKQLLEAGNDRYRQSLMSIAGVNESEANHFTASESTNVNDPTLPFKAIFASFSMTKTELKAVLEEAADEGAEVYFNGLRPGDKGVMDTLNAVQSIAGAMASPPNTRFNPDAFIEYGVTQVPTILMRHNGQVAIAKGTISFDYLGNQMTHQEQVRFNYGAQGPLKPVIEKSIILEIQERIARIDWESKRNEAINQFWNKQDFNALPAATKDATWYIDPTVRITKDVTNHRGNTLARAGDVINPLKMGGNDLRLFIFNSTDPKQVQWLEDKLKQEQRNSTVMIITSEIEREQGWNHLEALNARFKSNVYLLQPQIVERFQLEGLPTVVETDLGRSLLKVTQYAINEGEEL